jgi:hypothetical protein
VNLYQTRSAQSEREGQFEAIHYSFCHSEPGESPVRKLLLAGQAAGSSRDKTAPRNDNCFLTDRDQKGRSLAKPFIS